MTEVKKKLGVWEKIFAIQQEVTTVKKGGRNEFHKYDYVKEEDLVAVIKPLLGTHKLSVNQIGAKQTVVGTLTLVDTKYRITDIESGDFVEVDGIGQGAAGDDKGAYKALTGSMKYFLAKFFMVPTGDDPENEGKALKGGAKLSASATQAKGAATKGGAASPAEQALAMIAKCKDEAKLEDWKAKAMASTVYSAADKKRVVDAIGERLAIITIV